MSKKGDKIKVSGIAVREGVSLNKRKYISKELKSFAPTLIGKPLLKDHEGYTDNVIGKVTNAEFRKDGGLVTYEGWIKEDGSDILEKIKDGRIHEVSIGAISGRVVKESEDSDILIPKDMKALELSTTPIPGVRGTSMFVKQENKIDLSDKAIEKMIKDYDKNSNSFSNENIKKPSERRLNMESEEKEKALKLQVETLEKEKAEAEKANTEKVEALEKEKVELEKARKQDAIDRYAEKAKAKGMEVKDLSNKSMETIQMAIEMADELPEPKPDEDEDKDPDKEPDKKPAEPKTKDPVDNQFMKPSVFEGYVIDSEDVVRGNAFYKYC